MGLSEMQQAFLQREGDNVAYFAPGPCNLMTTTRNIIMGVAGAGVLALPHATAQAGLYSGVVLLLLSFVLSLGCTILTGSAMKLARKLAKPGDVIDEVEDMGNIVQPGGNLGQIMTVVTFIDLWFTVVVYIVTMAKMLGTAVCQFMDYSVGDIYLPLVWILVFALTPLVLAKDQEEIGKYTQYGVMCNCIMFMVILFDCVNTCLRDGIQTEFVASNNPMDFRTILQSYGNFIFAFAVSVLVPSIYKDMREPQKFNTAAVASHCCVLVAYLALCISAYLAYGPELVHADIMTDVMRLKWAVWVVPVLFTMSLCTGLPLFITPIGTSIQHHIMRGRADADDPQVERNMRYKIRFSLLVSCAAVASIGDQVALFQAFCGAVTTTCTCMFFPAILPALLKYRERFMAGYAESASFISPAFFRWFLGTFTTTPIVTGMTITIILAAALGFSSGLVIDGTDLVEQAR